MAILRHSGPPDYFITFTCNKVNLMLYLSPFASPHKTVHDIMSSINNFISTNTCLFDVSLYAFQPLTPSYIYVRFCAAELARDLTRTSPGTNGLRPTSFMLQNIQIEAWRTQGNFIPAPCSSISCVTYSPCACKHIPAPSYIPNVFLSFDSIVFFRQVLPKVLGSVVYHLGVIEFQVTFVCICHTSKPIATSFPIWNSVVYHLVISKF